MLVFWHLLVDEHHVGGDGVGLVLDPLPHGLHVGGDGLSLVCLQLGLGHPPPGHHVDDGRPPAPLQAGLAHDDLIGYVLGHGPLHLGQIWLGAQFRGPVFASL